MSSMNAIDRSSTVPLYSQIKQILIRELQGAQNGTAPTLTEASLIKRFHVSRAPIRQALKELVDDGYVVRQRAKGTFPVRGVNVRLPPAMELGALPAIWQNWDWSRPRVSPAWHGWPRPRK